MCNNATFAMLAKQYSGQEKSDLTPAQWDVQFIN